MKNYFKKNKQKAVNLPRELEDIRKEYNELSLRAANAQYLVFVHSKDLEQVNNRLIQVNQEAGARQALDTEKSKASGESVNPSAQSGG